MRCMHIWCHKRKYEQFNGFRSCPCLEHGRAVSALTIGTHQCVPARCCRERHKKLHGMHHLYHEGLPAGNGFPAVIWRKSGPGRTVRFMQSRFSPLFIVIGLPLLGALSAGLMGCPENSCFLKVCQGNSCRCSISSCGDGAAFDTKQNRCRCLKGFIPLAGQCMTQDQANAYCGVGHHFENGGCVENRCAAGEELDVSTGRCIPPAQVNQVAGQIGVSVGQGQKLGCPAGQKLIIEGSSAACVPLSQTCARDETWTGQACVKVGQCPTGAIWDPALAQCVQYAQGSESNELVINVAQWSSANFGPNGGFGTPAFCGAFAKKPFNFGIVEGATAFVRITLSMTFPSLEVAKGHLTSGAVFDASGNPVPARGAADVDSAAQTTFGTLLVGGGRANVQSHTTTVKCAVVNAAKPLPVPATGGL